MEIQRQPVHTEADVKEFTTLLSRDPLSHWTAEDFFAFIDISVEFGGRSKYRSQPRLMIKAIAAKTKHKYYFAARYARKFWSYSNDELLRLLHGPPLTPPPLSSHPAGQTITMSSAHS